jgi:hypothetical protein
MTKLLIAFFLGLFSFLLMMFVGETAGLPAMFAVMTMYFFTCQYFLSRSHADAHRKDWRIMLALDTIPVVAVLIMVAVEKWDVILSQGPIVLLSTFGGTFAGAVVASVTAKRTAARPLHP